MCVYLFEALFLSGVRAYFEELLAALALFSQLASKLLRSLALSELPGNLGCFSPPESVSTITASTKHVGLPRVERTACGNNNKVETRV